VRLILARIFHHYVPKSTDDYFGPTTEAVKKIQTGLHTHTHTQTVVKYTEWLKSLCAPNDYNTESVPRLSPDIYWHHQGHGDTRLTLTPSVISNSIYVVTVSEWSCLKYFCVFFWTVIVRCTETFWSYFISTNKAAGILGHYKEKPEIALSYALLCHYDMCHGNFLPTFRVGGCTKTMARNNHYTMRNNTEERSY
jgi:hypothetical protein